jgi:hypothetical protein
MRYGETKEYDIQLALDQQEALLLVQILEAFACEIENEDCWSGGSSKETINLVDNIVSTIMLSVKDEESSEAEVDFKNTSKWLYHKGG